MASAFDVNSSTLSNTILCGSMSKDVLETSAKLVDNFIQLDNSCYEMIDCLKMGGASLPTVSGLNDPDYPGISELGISLQSLTQLTTVKRIPLPPELVEQFGLMQSNCQMGLFPEVGRAWLTIDSRIFLWSFHDGSDLAYYDSLKETILCVGLVKPKPGVFQSIIHYLLCLTTPTEIVILGANFSRQNQNSPLFEEMHLLPEPLFVYPSDNVHMCVFNGTEDGRIFLGGKDGAVYEFAYRDQDTWISRKCWTINHSNSSLSFLVPYFLKLVFSEDDAVLQIAIDSSRHILYTRHEKGSIQAKILTRKSKAATVESVKVLDDFLSQLVCSVDIDIMPGEFDPANHLMPQQPLHPCMFPKSAAYSTFHVVTNPYDSVIDGVRFLGSSGQNIKDIQSYSRISHPLDVLQKTLDWCHMSPTAPDTLNCYPFHDEDPFILSEYPHVYFAGNMSQFGVRHYKNKARSLMISVPKFQDTFCAVLVNLKNLEVEPVVFEGLMQD